MLCVDTLKHNVAPVPGMSIGKTTTWNYSVHTLHTLEKVCCFCTYSAGDA